MGVIRVTADNYENFIENYFVKLPRAISLRDGNQVLTNEDISLVANSNEAKQAANIVYIFMSSKPIPRAKGQSKILYIGQTKRNLKSRYGNGILNIRSKANELKYNHFVHEYGAINVYFIELSVLNSLAGSSLLELEGQFLWWYFKNHIEYPPINYTKTKVRTDYMDLEEPNFNEV